MVKESSGNGAMVRESTFPDFDIMMLNLLIFWVQSKWGCKAIIKDCERH